MQSIGQGFRTSKAAGEPIYNSLQQFASVGAHIRRGQSTLVAAAPGIGKSAMVHFICQLGDRRGNRNSVLYFSADSDPSVMFKRSAAMVTGYTQDEVHDVLHGPGRLEMMRNVDQQTRNVWWTFASPVSTDDVIDEVEAYTALYGEPPEIIVFDNIRDVYDPATQSDEFAQLDAVMTFAKHLARDTGAAVICLHHVVGTYENGNEPVPLSGLRGKVGKLPELILTLFKPSDGVTGVSVVKNRNGQASPGGDFLFHLGADLAHMAYN